MEDFHQMVQRTLEEITAGLQCTRLIVLAYSSHDGRLLAKQTVGVTIPDLHGLRLTLSEFRLRIRRCARGRFGSLTAAGGSLPEA